MLNQKNFVGFYHEYEKYGCFSNWYAAPFEYAGKEYANSEQFMMYQKAMAFGQFDAAKQIMATTDPKECKDIGRTHFPNWDGDYWDRICCAIVKRGVKAKFIQNPDIRKELLATGNALLAECSEKDTNWGIGLDIKDKRRFDVSEWKGKNYLGRILMEVREELRALSSMAPGNREIKYRDAINMRHIKEWEMTFGELMRIPKYRKVVSDYLEIIVIIMGAGKRAEMMGLSPAQIEGCLRKNTGDYPSQDCWEMKQDFYETASNMWIVASGFDAPVCGSPLPKGAKLEEQEDGLFRIVMPGEDK